MKNKSQTTYTEPFIRRHRSLFVSLFVLVPVILLPILIIYTMAKSDHFQQWCTLHVVYENSQGLARGNQVSMSGTAIGHVRSVELIRERVVHVSFDVNSRYKHLVHRDTRARMRQRGFVGDWELELTGGTPAAGEVQDNDTLASERVSTMDDMIELATGVIDSVMLMFTDLAKIVRGIEEGQGTVGQILKNDTLFRNINAVSANAVAISAHTIGITRDVANVMKDIDSLVLTLNNAGRGSVALIDSVTALIATANESIEKAMVEVDGILKNLRSVSDDTPVILDRLMDDLGEVEIMLRNMQESRAGRILFGGAPDNPNLLESP